MLIGMLFIPALVAILVGLWLLADSLREDWWQGIAGIAQMGAGLLAMWTVIQARKTIRLADEERKHSVRPDWDITGSIAGRGRVERDSLVSAIVSRAPFGYLTIDLWNSGLGPARDAKVAFEPHNDNEPHRFTYRLQGQGPHVVLPAARIRVVLPDAGIRLNIAWQIGRPLDGLLIVTCETRFGERLHNTFHLQTWTDCQGVPCYKLTRVC